MDLISVLIPIYNACGTLDECLTSILAQNDPFFEVVAVDDGSNDGTAEILCRYSRLDDRVRVYRLPENRGIVAALNHGLAYCQGRWVARMDADDRMLPDRLVLQREYMETNPGVDLLGARVRIFRERGEPSPGQIRYQDWSNGLLTDSQIRGGLFMESPIMHPSFFATRTVFQRLAGYHDESWAEDYDFLHRAAREGLIFAKLDRVLVEKRDSPTRLYRTDPRCGREAMLRAKCHFLAVSGMVGRRRVWVAGTGSSGRKIATFLHAEGLHLAGFLDNVVGPPNRTVKDLPVHRWDESNAPLDEILQDGFAVLGIGNHGAAARLEARLIDLGLKSSSDYLRFL